MKYKSMNLLSNESPRERGIYRFREVIEHGEVLGVNGGEVVMK